MVANDAVVQEGHSLRDGHGEAGIPQGHPLPRPSWPSFKYLDDVIDEGVAKHPVQVDALVLQDILAQHIEWTPPTTRGMVTPAPASQSTQLQEAP